MKATPEQKERFKNRINMWSNCRHIFGSWDQFLALCNIQVHGKTKRIRKKTAKVLMGSVINNDLIEFGMSLMSPPTEKP